MIPVVIVLLILIGILLIFAEILVIPGSSVAGFIGFLFYVIGVLFAYDHYGRPTGHIILASTAIGGGIVILLALRSNIWRKFQSKNQLEGSANDLNIGDIEVGDRGEALTDINPSGNALIHNEIFEVFTSGELIAAQTEIEVTLIEDNKLIVRKS